MRRKKIILDLNKIPAKCDNCGSQLTRRHKTICFGCNDMIYECPNATKSIVSLGDGCEENYEVLFPKGNYDLPHINFRGTFIPPDIKVTN